MRRGNLVIIVGERRTKSDRFPEHLNRFRISFRRLVRLSQMKVGIRVSRLDEYRLLQQTNSRIPSPIHQINDAEIIVGEEFIWICSQLNLEFLFCFRQPRGTVLQQVSETQVVMSSRKMRIEANCPIELVDGFGQKTCFSISAAKYDAKLRPIAELPDHAVKNLLRGSD